MTYRLFDGKESVAHPPARGAVPADVREPPLVVSVGGAEGHLLDGLVDDEAASLVVHHPEAVPAHVQHSSHALPLGRLRNNQWEISFWSLKMSHYFLRHRITKGSLGWFNPPSQILICF